jgi:uncharacterized protein (TIGR02453 family)
MTFKGWGPAAIEFFERLEDDNSREYWHAHKHVYEDEVRRPMQELLDALAPQCGDGKIFRPNRDVRFSADKSPYKTNIAAVQSKGGYITLSADGLGVGRGLYMPEAEQLERFRRAIDDDRKGRALEQIVAALERKHIEVGAHETLKTAPRGYPKDHPRIELLRMKGITAWRQWPPGPALATAKPKQHIVQFLRDSEPLVDWLDAVLA